MSLGILCPNLTKLFQKEVSKIANDKLPIATTIGGLSVNLNHLKRGIQPYSASKITVLDKRHNFKPGALALAEIRHYQNVEGLILSPTVMKRLCLEIA